jgi:hypothetical protein
MNSGGVGRELTSIRFGALSKASNPETTLKLSNPSRVKSGSG